jgi:hypothetical protein
MSAGLQGIVRIEVVDSITKEVKKSITQKNIVVDRVFQLYFNNGTGIGSTFNPAFGRAQNFEGTGQSSHIFISSSTLEPSFTTSFQSSIPTVFVLQPTLGDQVLTYNNYDYSYVEYYAQFSNPGGSTTREINTVGLCPLSESTRIAAYLKLTETCIQGPTDFLNVYYRVQAVAPEGPNQYGDLEQAMANFIHSTFISRNNQTGSQGPLATNSLYTLPLSKNPNYAFVRPCRWHNDASAQQGNVLSYPSQYTKVFTTQYNEATNMVGKILRSYVRGVFGPRSNGGTDARSIVWETFNWPSEPIFQGMFGHSNDASGPFFSATESQSGTGRVVMSGNWNKEQPEIYKILITQSGQLGTATYRWAKRQHFGFIGNNWSLSSETCPFIPYSSPMRAKGYGLYNLSGVNSSHRFIRYDNQTVLTWGPESTLNTPTPKQGVSLTNIYTGDFVDIGPNETVHLPVLDIAQVAVNGKLLNMNDSTPSTRILIACRVTGLWEVIPSTEQVFHRSSTPCYGVEIGLGGKVIALFEGRVSSSDDYSEPLPFSFTGISNDNWERVRYIKVDPQSATFDTGIILTNPLSIVWWSTSQEQGIQGPSTQSHLTDIDTFPNYRFECSSVDSLWAYTDGSSTRFTTFGLSTGTQRTSAPRVHLIGRGLLRTNNVSQGESRPHDLSASANYVGMWFPNTASTMRIIDLQTDSQISYDTSPDSRSERGFFIAPKLMIWPASYANTSQYPPNNGQATIMKPWGHPESPDYWDEYGWDGNAWVRDHLGTKTLHSGVEALDASVSVRFENGAAGTSFVATDYYTQCCSKGVMKDNATTIGFKTSITSRPSYQGIELPPDLTVPASEPYELVCPSAPGGSDPHVGYLHSLNVLPSFFSLTLDGVSVPAAALILHDQAASNPSVGQVKITADKFIFNEADAGKAFSGTYSFVSRS